MTLNTQNTMMRLSTIPKDQGHDTTVKIVNCKEELADAKQSRAVVQHPDFVTDKTGGRSQEELQQFVYDEIAR
jgi:hypothetical protein